LQSNYSYPDSATISIEIALKDPWVSRVLPEGGSQELPVSSLKNDGSHLHGELLIVVDGEPIPRMGYFGPRDVCVTAWVRELRTAARELRSSDPARHLYDECEQGQPAFLFERRGETVTVSVVDSELGDGVGNPEWGRRSCSLAEFGTEVERFVSELEAILEDAAPGNGRAWVRSLHEGAG
jgi:hypothetical protein